MSLLNQEYSGDGGVKRDILLKSLGFLTRVREPYVAVRVDEEIVNGIEVAAKVVIQQGGSFVRGRVKCSDSGPLFGATDAGITSRCSPIDNPIMKCATIGSINWWIR